MFAATDLRRRGALMLIALAALCPVLGCDEGPPLAADVSPADAAGFDADGFVDAGPLDEGRDAQPADLGAAADGAADGAPPLRIGPWPARLVEGRPTRLTLELTATAPGPVHIVAPDLAMQPAQVVLDPGADETSRAEVVVTAPFDADEAPGTGWLSARAATADWRIPLPIIDAHHTLELVMTPEQVAAVRAERERETRYRVGTRLDGAPGPDAEINLRGKGTFFCARRSFTVRFDEPVRIGDSPPLEHVTLLSMCEDTPYLRMHSAAVVMAAAGIFPPWFTYTELRYGDGTRGVYLLVERPRKAAARLAGDGEGLVIRRLNDAEEEIKVPDERDIADREALLAPYRALYQLAGGLAGQPLLEQLDRRMDYDGYLDWLAVNSALENGDYRDEVYFFARPGPPGAAAPYFGLIPWDYDGVQTRCHVGDPIPEPLMYCAESGLDLPVSTDPVVQARYVARLSALLAGPLSPAAYAEAVHRSAAELALYLDRPGVAAIMTRDGIAPAPMADADAMSARQAQRVEALRGLMP